MAAINKLVMSVALATALAAGTAQATTIYPVSATASSSYSGYEALYAIDQGGSSANTDWANGSVGAFETLNLDLGAVYSLANAYVTDRVTSGGGNGSFVGGLYDFTFKFQLQAYTSSSFSTPIGAPVVVNVLSPVCQDTPACFLTIVPLAGLTAEYLQYTILSQEQSLGDQAPYNNAGLSDIHFTATPLPSTWMMLIAGFAGLGFFAYRGKKNRSAVLAAA
jgi:hypothetical protein